MSRSPFENPFVLFSEVFSKVSKRSVEASYLRAEREFQFKKRAGELETANLLFNDEHEISLEFRRALKRIRLLILLEEELKQTEDSASVTAE